jgi:DNA polymerase-1
LTEEKRNSSNTSRRYVVIDAETDDLDATVVWVVVTKDLSTGEVREWYSPELLALYLSDAFIIGHNLLWFDIPVLNRLWHLGIDPERCIDTLVVSRLINSWDYSQHGLGAWGIRLGFPKGDFHDFSKLTPEMVTYCIRDVELTEQIFLFLKRFIEDPKLSRSMQVEHRAAIICREMHDNGFGFDIRTSRSLYERIEGELKGLGEQISIAFPPRRILSRTILPRPTKTGAVSRVDFRWIKDGRSPEEHGATVGVPFHVYETIEFNPNSPKQCIERLNEFGWRPTEKTKGHVKAERDLQKARGPDRVLLKQKLEDYKVSGWTISEENLATLPPEAPQEAKLLTRYILLLRRLTTLDEWISAYNERSQSIHGEVNAIGTWTHRASHKNPNTGNIARVTSEFGSDMRELWRAGVGYRQVGCDAEGIQLRILAHYMDDEEFTKALVSGRSEDGTDVHTLNWRALGEACKDRTTAKTFIYSYLLGASAGKTAQIFQCSVTDATRARDKFVNTFPGLKRIREEVIPHDVDRGYFIGVDGRPVMCDSAHHMLAGYLQNGETVVMKLANWEWRRRLLKERIPFWQMAYVHDEWQTRTIDDEDVANYIGQVQAESIKWAGEQLELKCPLAGSFKIGYNWKDCH